MARTNAFRHTSSKTRSGWGVLLSRSAIISIEEVLHLDKKPRLKLAVFGRLISLPVRNRCTDHYGRSKVQTHTIGHVQNKCTKSLGFGHDERSWWTTQVAKTTSNPTATRLRACFGLCSLSTYVYLNFVGRPQLSNNSKPLHHKA